MDGYYKLILWLDKRYNSVALIGRELLSFTSCPIRTGVCKYRPPLIHTIIRILEIFYLYLLWTLFMPQNIECTILTHLWFDFCSVLIIFLRAKIFPIVEIVSIVNRTDSRSCEDNCIIKNTKYNMLICRYSCDEVYWISVMRYTETSDINITLDYQRHFCSIMVT